MPSIIKQAGNLPFVDSVKIPDYIPKETPTIETNEDDENQLDELELLEENNDKKDGKTENVSRETLFHETDFDAEVEHVITEEEISDIETILRRFSKDELREIFSEELEEIKLATSKNAYKNAYQVAYDEAYAKTISQRRGEIQESIQRVSEGLLEMQEAHKEFLSEYAIELKYLAIDIAEKMIHQKIDDDEMILETLVKKTVVEIKNTAWFDIEVSDKLAELVETLRKDLEFTMPNTRVTISQKPISKDSIRVNTNEGTVVSSVSAQAENLRNIFKKNEN